MVDSLTCRPNAGSSPRAWGTLFSIAAGTAPWRFIPTGVGNSGQQKQLNEQQAVHPHGRGELMRPAPTCDRVNGSSPRAWGTPGSISFLASGLRFIPTGVGNSHSASSSPVNKSVHPHGRGELALLMLRLLLPHGSSPRAWGTQFLKQQSRDVARFIPTGVGNSFVLKNRLRQGAVHPHGRGELKKNR